jgi:hypothetical protein
MCCCGGPHQRHLIAEFSGAARGRLDAGVCHNSRYYDLFDTALPELKVEVSIGKFGGRDRQPVCDRLHENDHTLQAAVNLTQADWARTISVKESWLVPPLFRGSPNRW